MSNETREWDSPLMAEAELEAQYPQYQDEFEKARQQRRQTIYESAYATPGNGHENGNGAAEKNGERVVVEVVYEEVGIDREDLREELRALFKRYSDHTASAGPNRKLVGQFSDLKQEDYIDDDAGIDEIVDRIGNGTKKDLIRWIKKELEKPYVKDAAVEEAAPAKKKGKPRASKALRRQLEEEPYAEITRRLQ